MRKWVWILLIAGILTGCSAQETFETLGQIDHEMQPQLRQVVLDLPEDASLETAVDGTGITGYACDGYLLAVQTMPAGAFDETIAIMTGFPAEKLTVVESSCGDHTRYDFTWTAASEEGELVCRGAVLSDGGYHYCLIATTSSAYAQQLHHQWNEVFGSFCLDDKS